MKNTEKSTFTKNDELKFKEWTAKVFEQFRNEICGRKQAAEKSKTLEDLSLEAFNDNSIESASKILLEGMWLTYPTDVVKKWFVKFFEDKKRQGIVFSYEIETMEDEGGESTYPILLISCTASMAFDPKMIFESRISYFGWYVGKQIDKDVVDEVGNYNKFLAYVIEPRFPIENSIVEKYTKKVIDQTPNGIFYHATFAKFADDVRLVGLQPNNSKRDVFIYPDRIYLFDNIDSMRQFCTVHITSKLSHGELEHTIQTNKRFIGNSIGEKKTPIVADAKYQDPSAGMVCFSVNLKQMWDDGKLIRLYHDNRFGDAGTAYFTQNSIPAKYLTEIGKVDIPEHLRPEYQ